MNKLIVPSIYWLFTLLCSAIPLFSILTHDSKCPNHVVRMLSIGWACTVLCLASLFFFLSTIGSVYSIIFFFTPPLCIFLIFTGGNHSINCENAHTFSVYIIFALGTSVLLLYFCIAVCYYLGSPHAWPKLLNIDPQSRHNQPFHVDFVKSKSVSFKMGLSSSPGRMKGSCHRNLDDDLDRLGSAYGVTRIISMLDPFAVEKMGLQSYAQKCHQRGIAFHSVPLRDKWIPINQKFFREVIRIYRCVYSTNETILIHCNGGRGRTAVFAVCLLLLCGLNFSEAVTKVRSARPRMLRNPLQIIFCFHCWIFRVMQKREESRQNAFDLQSQSQAPYESPYSWNPETSLPEMV